MTTKKKNSSPALTNIRDPTPSDVLFGRGGGTNHHPGNKRYRKLVDERKLEYVNSERLDKPLVAVEIVRIVRQLTPPGRFLKRDDKTNLWNDVGDKEAQKKVSQALREGAAVIRDQQETEALGKKPASNSAARRKPVEGSSKTKQKQENPPPIVTNRQASDQDTASMNKNGSASVTNASLYINDAPKYIRPKEAHIPDQITKKVVDSDVVKSAPPPMPRPMAAKRATSYENESIETKRDLKGLSVKRATLSRDKSPTSNNLKKAYLRESTNSCPSSSEEEDQPDSRSDLPPLHPLLRASSVANDDMKAEMNPRQPSTEDNTKRRDENVTDRIERGKVDCDSELRRLSNTFEQTTLNGFIAPARQFSNEERMRDMDVLYAELTNNDTMI